MSRLFSNLRTDFFFDTVMLHFEYSGRFPCNIFEYLWKNSSGNSTGVKFMLSTTDYYLECTTEIVRIGI